MTVCPSAARVGWRQLSHTPKAARQLCAAIAVCMLLGCLYTYHTMNPTEPYIKRSHSSTTGRDRVEVIFTSGYNDDNDDDNNDRNITNTNIAVKDIPPPANSHNVPNAVYPVTNNVSTGEDLPVKEFPFSSEVQFDTTLHKFRNLHSPTSSVAADTEEMPAGILQIIQQNAELREKIPPDIQQMMQQHYEGVVQDTTERSPVHQTMSEKQSVPHWVLSLLHPRSDQENVETQPKLVEKKDDGISDVVWKDLIDLDEQETFDNGANKAGVKDDADEDRMLVIASQIALNDNLIDKGSHLQRVQASGLSAITNKPGNMKQPAKEPAHTSQLSDPDFFNSTEMFEVMKHKNISPKLPRTRHVKDGTEPEKDVHKWLLSPARENVQGKTFDLRSENTLTKHGAVPQPSSPNIPEEGSVEMGVKEYHKDSSKQVHKVDHEFHKDSTEDQGSLQQSEAGHYFKKTTSGTNRLASAPNNTNLSKKSPMTAKQLPSKPRDSKIQHHHQPNFNLTVWKSVLKERKRLLRSKCQEHSYKQSFIEDTNILVDHKRNLLYCPVGKTAAGFFHRLFFTLKHTNHSVKELPSPFQVSLSAAMAEEYDTLIKLRGKGTDEVLGKSLRFLIVREPFSRLFAAYVDKLLVPDSEYWRKWGVPAITRHRKYPSAKSLSCGHDVTFAEFVKFVIESLHESDDTVRPVSALCSPCNVKFSVVGHLETLVSDIEYVLSLIKVSITSFSRETFMSDVNDDIISDSALRAFEFYEHLKTCISKYEMGKRLWKNLQIHGIISEELTFSFAPKKVDKMTPSDFIELVRDARGILPHSDRVRQQKVSALKSAFEQVPAEDVMELVKIYALDFELFGYDRHPSFLL